MTNIKYTYDACTPTRSVYIHWPFCPYKCNFCPFVALASHDQFMSRYHVSLCREIELFARHSTMKLPLDTVFMGGGTPSTYPNDLLLDMVGILKEACVVTSTTEITIEVNPGTVTPERLHLWKELGINRLSIGVQSLKDSLLKTLNRHQSAADVYYVLDQARTLFDNMSIDLIVGLPTVTNDEWKDLLREVVTWPIKHISIYFLTIHENTPLYFRVQEKKVTLPYDDDVIDLYYWSRDFLAEHGIYQYEISNFARPGYESRHNQAYWQRTPYKGFGLGACSFDGTVRFQNEKNLMKYMDGVEKAEDITIYAEALSAEQIRMEKIMLGIRQTQGVIYADIVQGLSDEGKDRVRQKVDMLAAQGFVTQENGRLKLTTRGLSVEHEIATQLSL